MRNTLFHKSILCPKFKESLEYFLIFKLILWTKMDWNSVLVETRDKPWTGQEHEIEIEIWSRQEFCC